MNIFIIVITVRYIASMYMYLCTDNVVSHFLFINRRAWVLVNSKGIYQNLISIPKLALVQPSFEDGRYLCLNAPGMPLLKLDIHMKGDDGAEKAMIKYVFALHYLHIYTCEYCWVCRVTFFV